MELTRFFAAAVVAFVLTGCGSKIESEPGDPCAMPIAHTRKAPTVINTAPTLPQDDDRPLASGELRNSLVAALDGVDHYRLRVAEKLGQPETTIDGQQVKGVATLGLDGRCEQLSKGALVAEYFFEGDLGAGLYHDVVGNTFADLPTSDHLFVGLKAGDVIHADAHVQHLAADGIAINMSKVEFYSEKSDLTSPHSNAVPSITMQENGLSTTPVVYRRAVPSDGDWRVKLRHAGDASGVKSSVSAFSVRMAVYRP